MARPTVVLTDPIDQAGLDLLTGRVEVVRGFGGVTPDELAGMLRQADGMIVRAFRATAEVITGLPRLKVIVKHGAGVDNIDVDAATARGVAVVNTPQAGAVAVAEHTVMLMMAAARRAVPAHEAVRSGDYRVRDVWRLTELHDKVLGIVGLGHIGRRVAHICAMGLGMRVVAYDPFLPEDAEAVPGVTRAGSLGELLRMADVLTLHAPLTTGSAHLVGAEEIAAMKPGAILVNTARGGLVDEQALAVALREGRLTAAALDVFEVEPPEPGNPLFDLPNVLTSPHVGGLSWEGAARVALAAAETAVSFLCEGGTGPGRLLNPAYLAPAR
ncbi:hypothetical protein GCM10009836_25380 [Pseudonocardia ailaonensis]|uniref:Hydroxyacid dehydrogenase n=1 Tax=Pseudonocardia ailaonensis TaxID=367279 RepID=A0ABN2N073_9PSEU